MQLTCGNLPTSHPLYARFVAPSAGNEAQSLINRAANKFVAYAVGGSGAGAQLFPELQNSWTAGPTVAGQNYLARPSDMLVLTDVACANLSTLPNWATTRELPMTFMDRVPFGNLQKDSSVKNYPTIWTTKGKNVFIWPTPDSTHIDYLRYYGIKLENVLVNASDSFFMDEIWHDFVALLASEMLCRRLGWKDQADDLFQRFKDDVSATINVMSAEQQPVVLQVEGAPSRASVMGA